MLRRLLGLDRSDNDEIVDRLYGEIVAAARRPSIYADWGAPDTPLGRYEIIALHLILMLERLDGQGPAARAVAQSLTDQFFIELDHSLRELGISDTGVPKRMKRLARMFYGRAASYAHALRQGDRDALAEALARNVMPEAAQWPGARQLAEEAFRIHRALADQPIEAILAGRTGIAAPPRESPP